MLILPIRTESASRRTPLMNYILIGVNIALFLILDDRLLGREGAAWRDHHLVFRSADPALYQFLTYQFLHADITHLLGNLLFLWVFGNSVNAKMGDVPYLLFYLAGGVFAAWGYAVARPVPFSLLGASGAIAAVTTAYLALFPRSHVTVFVWLFFIYFFEVPAMLLIGVKIIVWDNLVAPSVGGAGNVAHAAHLAGYLFGFFSAMLLLLVRALPRDQFDMLALWRRWKLRREIASVAGGAAPQGGASFGTVGRSAPADADQRQRDDARLDQLAERRSRVGEALERRDFARATEEYERLIELDPRQCLSEMQQLDVAQEFYRSARFPAAAAALERFLEQYPRAREADNVRLLLGIVYARDLQRYERAETLLAELGAQLQDDTRRSQCAQWLDQVRTALGRKAEMANGESRMSNDDRKA